MLRLTLLSILAISIAPQVRAGEGLPPVPASAAPPTAHAPAVGTAAVGSASRARAGWLFAAAIARRHDDNILQLPRHDLDRLAANPTPPRFLVETPDDDVTEFDADAARRLRLLPKRETRVQASAAVNRFQRNTVKNWEQYELMLQQELTASQHSLTTLRLWWNVLPRFYLGQITDADDSFAAGTRIRRALTFAQTGMGFRFAQRLPGRVSFAAGAERLHRDYDAHFDERDNDNTQWRIEAGVQPFPRWGVTAGLTYLAGRLEARGDLAASPIRDTDISYEHHGLGTQLQIPWGRGAGRGMLQASWQPESRRYTTVDKFDLSRFGRVNHRAFTSLRATQRVWGPVEAVASFDRLTSDATFPEPAVFSADDTDFRQTRWGLLLRSRWGIRPR